MTPDQALNDSDRLQEVLENILMDYRPRDRRDEFWRRRLKEKHDEAEIFMLSLRDVLRQHPGSPAYRILLLEARELEKHEHRGAA